MELEKRGPGRPRKEETARGAGIKSERRRRQSDALAGVRKRLAIDESKLDRENFEYYFAKNTPDRLHQLTVQDDWEIVTDREGEIRQDGNGQGSEVSVLSGTGENGAPLNSVLLKKAKNYYNDDFAAKQRRIDEMENAMRRGPADGEQNYTPDGRKSAMELSVDN